MDDFQRIATAIEYLIEQRAAQPGLDEIAAQVGLSRFHFQRLFKRYAGVTPKQFLAALTLESAKPLLDGDALESGAPARSLHLDRRHVAGRI
jgi:AraC family transcriptional regulator of adaptative response/methylated-DNA-[protein]-cysteine methyltransferase